MTRFIHVTRLPPSPSGVALYACEVEQAYAMLGEVEVHRMPPDPRSSQSFPLAVRTWLSLRRRVPRGRDTIVSVELAGRGLAEMWAAWLLARGGRRVWLTVHDVPTLCGAPFLSRTWDRRGLRRVGLALSRLVGRPAERGLLERAETVATLSAAGAAALEKAYALARPVLRVPHVLSDGPVPSDERRILVPGYVGGSETVLPLVRLLAALPAGWRLAVGAASDTVMSEISALAGELGVAESIDLLGFVDEDVLDREFARAAIVVRWRPDGWLSGYADYAVSGPLIRALGRGCAVVTNDRRGTFECLRAAGATIVGDEEGAMTAEVRRLVDDESLRRSQARAGLVHIAEEHSPRAVASLLSEVM